MSDDAMILGRWRIALRQAEESARAGRYPEALAFLSEADVANHRQIVQLQARLLQDLVARATRRGAADDFHGAIDDLALAERYHAAPDLLAETRRTLADQVTEEIQSLLQVGDPLGVLDRINFLAQHKITGPQLRRRRETAEAWKQALDDIGRAEFAAAADALERCARLGGDLVQSALQSTLRDLDHRREQLAPRVEKLYAALGAGKWADVLAAAEAVLALAPEHDAARQARARSWQHLAAVDPSPALGFSAAGRAPLANPNPNPPAPKPALAKPKPDICWLDEPAQPQPVKPAPRPAGYVREQEREGKREAGRAGLGGMGVAGLGRHVATDGPKGRVLLWADVIGGYLFCLDDQIVLGRASHDGTADVPILGDLSRQHAVIARSGEGYVLRAIQPTFLNGRRIDSAPLRDRDVIRLGAVVEMEFRQPSPVSATARLVMLSGHRLPQSVHAVILMADTCIMGASPQAHLPASQLTEPVVLYRHGQSLWCRAAGTFAVDGRPCSARAPLTLQSHVVGDDFSFSLESLNTNTRNALA